MARTRWTHKRAQGADSQPTSRPGKRLKRTAPPRHRRPAPNRALVSPSPPPPENPSSSTEVPQSPPVPYLIDTSEETIADISQRHFYPGFIVNHYMLHLERFDEVATWLETHKLIPFCEAQAEGYSSLVKEFYCNLRTKHSGANFQLTSFVRGNQIALTPALVCQLIGVEHASEAKDSDIELEALNYFFAEVVQKAKVFPSHPSPNLLTASHRMLHWIYGGVLLPRNNFSTVTRKDSCLMYKLIKGYPLDLGGQILKHMIQVRNNTKQRLSLPYFGLISRLLEHFQVDCSVDPLTFLASLSLLTTRRLEKSALERKGRSWQRTPSAYQAALAAALKDNLNDASCAEPVAGLSGTAGTAATPSSTAQPTPVQEAVNTSAPQTPLERLEQEIKELRAQVDLLIRHFGLGDAHTLPTTPAHAATAADPVPPPSAAPPSTTHAASSTPILRRSKSF